MHMLGYSLTPDGKSYVVDGMQAATCDPNLPCLSPMTAAVYIGIPAALGAVAVWFAWGVFTKSTPIRAVGAAVGAVAVGYPIYSALGGNVGFRGPTVGEIKQACTDGNADACAVVKDTGV